MEIEVLKDILTVNDQVAQANREMLDRNGTTMVNIMSSPGSGKTSLILQTIRRLRDRVAIGVIEGDISSSIDADTIGREDIPVVQINTGGQCHLDAKMVRPALTQLPVDGLRLVFVENVGNLVCPGEFNIGEHLKVLILSVPEGDDKIYKYPLMFNIVDAVVINKLDLLPYTRFDVEAFSKVLRSINEKAQLFKVSCTSGEGLDDWTAWLAARLGA